MDLIENLSLNLKRERELRKLSQEKFSEILDIHTNYYSSLERGERNPTIRLVQKIADGLKTSPIKLLSQ